MLRGSLESVMDFFTSCIFVGMDCRMAWRIPWASYEAIRSLVVDRRFTREEAAQRGRGWIPLVEERCGCGWC